MKPIPHTALATACSLALALGLQATVFAPGAHAMQNIKCIKNEVGALAIRWSEQAGEARAQLRGDEGRKAPRGVVDALSREGRRLASACSTCGAAKEAERVRTLLGQLQQAASGQAGEASLRALDDTLAQIEGLRAEFGL
jgi:hypothetical protein